VATLPRRLRDESTNEVFASSVITELNIRITMSHEHARVSTSFAHSCIRVPQLIAAVAAATTALSAQGVPTRALTAPDAQVGEPFTFIGALRELRDGRVIVADTRDKVLQLVDVARGTVSQIGREGSGPGEYGLPLTVLPAAGDSTIVYDMLNSRFLVILPNGKPGTTFMLEQATPTRSQDGPAITQTALRNPRAIDANGRLYFEGSPISFGPDGVPRQADSIPVIRHDRRSKRTDTVAWLRVSKDAASATSSGTSENRSVSVRIGSNKPFDARDSWSVFPDGRIAVARLANYHVDIITPGVARVSGPPVPFTPVRVGNAEKAEYRKLMARSPSLRMSITDNNGSRQSSVSTTPAPFDEPESWPAVKPAFANNRVFVRATGEVWVQRQVAASAMPLFDVFNSTGRLVQRVTLPRGHQLVGFGNGTVYTVRLDEDDLQYLQRFRG
jgi:hypothetical protein